MYADDTVIFANSSTELERAIDSLQTYCEEWKLQVNCSKTKIMILGRGKNTCREEFYMHNEKIERVEEYKYLGLWFNHRGDFKKAQAELLKQASRAMYSLVSKSRKLDLPVDLQIELFHSLVVPIVTYGSEIWGFSMCNNIEKLHLKFLKLIMGVRTSTCSAAVYGETGTFPLYVGVYTRMIGFWCQTLQGKSNKLSHKLLKLMYTLHENGLYEWPWLQHVKKVLDNCGLSNICRSQASEENAKWLKLRVERNLKDQWIQKWYEEVSERTSCSTYRLYKTEYRMEPYLSMNLETRTSIIKLRTNNNKIPIVKGRHNNTPRENRRCDLCDLNVIGDEYHVIIECTNNAIERSRNKYIPRYFRTRPSMYNLTELLSSDNKDYMLNLSLFLNRY